MKSNQKGFSVIEILLVIVVVSLIGTVGWLVYDRQNNSSDTALEDMHTQVSQQEEATEEVVTPDPYEGWQVYINNEYGFELKHPENLEISIGSKEPSTDVHFQDLSGNEFVAVIVEPISGYCHFSLCDLSAESTSTINGKTWDYIAQQAGSGYGLEGSDVDPSEIKGNYYYRTTQGQYRYYVSFSSKNDDSALVMDSFKLLAN